jgi:ribosomal protein S18 acetylase RimI-like enzyme
MTAAISLAPLTRADVKPLAQLHRKAFPHFFLSELGEPFLIQFYRGFLTDETGVSVVARSADGSVLGCAVGTTEPARFFARLVRRHWAGFALASARASLTDPAKAPRLLRALRYRGGAKAESMGALLSSICVDPLYERQGLGRSLLDAWIREVAARGVDAASLSTDADNNDAVNAFYRSQGWQLADTYATPEGRLMNHYAIPLGGC